MDFQSVRTSVESAPFSDSATFHEFGTEKKPRTGTREPQSPNPCEQLIVGCTRTKKDLVVDRQPKQHYASCTSTSSKPPLATAAVVVVDATSLGDPFTVICPTTSIITTEAFLKIVSSHHQDDTVICFLLSLQQQGQRQQPYSCRRECQPGLDESYEYHT